MDPLVSKVAMRFAKTAAQPFPPEDMEEGGPAPSGASKRDIPKNHEYDPKALKPLAKMLWAMSVSLGHALTAYRSFTKLKSSQISPDGMVGGRGYVMSVKDVRTKLQEACEAISQVSDTVHDEINGPHWQPKLSDMGENDAEDVQKYIEEAEKNLESPEDDAEIEADAIESENDGPDGTPNEPKEESASEVPGSGAAEIVDRSDPVNSKVKQASLVMTPRSVIRHILKQGTSSIPVELLPGGPRVDTLDRGEQTGPYGSYNVDEPLGQDEWAETEGVGDEYNYPSDWSNDLSRKEADLFSLAESAVPDSNSDDTKTDARDFGIGYGAKGEGTEGTGLRNPSDSYAVFGPTSGLPNDPGGKMKGEDSDAMPFRYDISHDNFKVATAELPNDFEPPVARSDYYPDQKGNITSEAELPGTQMPAKPTPLIPRPAHLHEHMFAESGLPGDGLNNSYNFDKDTPNVGYRFEQADNPYIKWDSSTHNYRPDYSYGRPDGSDLLPNGN